MGAQMAVGPRSANAGRKGPSDFTIRPMGDGESDVLGRVFYDAVRHGSARAYSKEQREAWAWTQPDDANWAARLGEQSTVVAEADGRAIGFMTLNLETGYLDLAFVLAEAQGTGVADALYLVLEGRARAAGLTRLTSDASHLAKPFFLRHGWVLLGTRSAERSGVALQNWQMEKQLERGA